MNPSRFSPRDQVTVPTFPPGYDPPAPAPGGADLAHVVELVAHWLTIGTLVAAVVAVLAYALTCVVWPYRPCPRCHGASRLVVRRGRLRRGVTTRRCRRCHGTGLRLRLGRRAWNHYARFRHAARAHEQHRDGDRSDRRPR